MSVQSRRIIAPTKSPDLLYITILHAARFIKAFEKSGSTDGQMIAVKGTVTIIAAGKSPPSFIAFMYLDQFMKHVLTAQFFAIDLLADLYHSHVLV